MARPSIADADAGIVHHREHVSHPGLLLADEVADGAFAAVAERHHARRGGMNSQLVLERDDLEVVALAGSAFLVGEETSER